MELRRPEKSADSLIGLGVEKQNLRRVHKTLDGVGAADIEGVVAVCVVGGNEIELVSPFSNAGVGSVYSDRELVVLLSKLSCDLISAGRDEVNAAKIPYYLLVVC